MNARNKDRKYPLATMAMGDSMTVRQSKSRGSMRAAINAFCKGCIYDKTQPGTWRQQVESCTSKSCALFQFRPVSTVNETADEQDAA